MIEITHDELDAKRIADLVADDGAGAVITFLGTTRDNTAGRQVRFLEYEAYRPMADQQLAKVAEEMSERWDLKGVAISHRLGRLAIGETSLVVAVSSAHRCDAYEASAFSIDRIKQIVPIWKKEFFEGGEVWVGSQEDFDPLGAV
ncbi:MAG: molybdenum cofactor biosynthesis protein MoaE [SAR202 cluster bacterium]|nr:molybdenum cofactor biosynthesis protein MoaE [SAR202 cluster bacterium]MDP7103234.1 molybdenum cofactor biosynthesis protein MoaE [SAR202 cluster bacterium]MDP7224635.1 molybdenum cofactor biosynthesis protein MoaE [SAR202 cluster bacterium]MDP7414070.1 molybdenum cofactor biosynthesis protein MoaE [SAR202 cluster bacterium]HJO81139.1 molybdenum cofactor biosynthesis protein MoaE [SAR202 cluster bacterium]